MGELTGCYQSHGDYDRAKDAFWNRPGFINGAAADVSISGAYIVGITISTTGTGMLRWLPGASQSSRATGRELAGIARGHYETLRNAGSATGNVSTAVTETGGQLNVAI